MADSTKRRREGARGDPRSPDADEMVEVFLRRSVGQRGGPLYGPGRTKVPKSLADSLRLSPDLVETDGAGNPLPHTHAASTFGGATASTATHDAHPSIARDPETGDALDENDAETPRTETARRTAEIAEHAKSGPDRQGGKLAGESGSLDDVDRELQPLPGQTTATRQQSEQRTADAERDRALADEGSGAGAGAGGAAARGAGGKGASDGKGTSGKGARTGGEGGGGEKPLTKSQLRGMDEDVLADLARRNRVKVPKAGGKKALVDKLYDARVTLD